MTTQRERPATVAPTPRPAQPPVVWWALLGAAFVCFIGYLLVAWIVSGDATRTDPGPDDPPTWIDITTVINQIFPPVCALTLVTIVVRQSLRERRLSFDAKLLIGGFLLWWQDPLLSYIKPGVFYNANMVNFGSWTEQIPGWVTPNGRYTAEPTISIGFAYMWWFLGFAMFICGAMRLVQRRRPQITTPQLVGIGILVATVADFVFEATWIRTGAYAYPSTVHELTVDAGSKYQMPVYHAFLHGGGTLGAIAMLRYFRDDRGRSWVERGVDRLNMAAWKADLVSLLAVVAFVQLAFLCLTNVAIQPFTLNADQVPDYPSWMRNGICGPGTDYPCPGPGVPIFTSDTPPPGVP